MILSDIRHYLQNHKQATLGDLAVHFDTDPDAMRGMLAHWIQKGKVVKIEAAAACKKGCANCCGDAALEIYRWR